MKKILSIIGLAIFLPSSALAAFTYERDPAGSSVQSPIEFTILSSDIGSGRLAWKIVVEPAVGDRIIGDTCFPIATFPGSETFDLEIGTYNRWAIYQYSSADCSTAENYIDFNADSFEVIPVPLLISSTTINVALSAGVSNVSNVAATNLILVLGFVALLIAAGLIFRWVKVHVGANSEFTSGRFAGKTFAQVDKELDLDNKRAWMRIHNS